MKLNRKTHLHRFTRVFAAYPPILPRNGANKFFLPYRHTYLTHYRKKLEKNLISPLLKMRSVTHTHHHLPRGQRQRENALPSKKYFLYSLIARDIKKCANRNLRL